MLGPGVEGLNGAKVGDAIGNTVGHEEGAAKTHIE